jgi:DNA invertase Pin-like site-specific DNA recombinase
MMIGYARVSTQDQNSALQLDALKAVGCDRIFEEKASGAQRDRPELKAVLEYMRDDDVLVVWKLDRLARSLGQLIETVERLERRGIGFRSLTEQIDTTTPAGRLTFHIFGAMAEFERSHAERLFFNVPADRKGRFLHQITTLLRVVSDCRLPCDSQTEGRVFESRRGRHLFKDLG